MVYVPHDILLRAAYDGGALVDAVFHDDGERITVTWPNGRGACMTSPEVVEEFVDQINELRRKLAEAPGAAPAGR